jgi:hypothetical protein
VTDERAAPRSSAAPTGAWLEFCLRADRAGGRGSPTKLPSVSRTCSDVQSNGVDARTRHALNARLPKRCPLSNNRCPTSNTYSLVGLLFGDSLERVLAELLLRPNRGSHVRELARITYDFLRPLDADRRIASMR